MNHKNKISLQILLFALLFILSTCKQNSYNQTMVFYIESIIQTPTLIFKDTNMIAGVAIQKFDRGELNGNVNRGMTIEYINEFKNNYNVPTIEEAGLESKGISKTIYLASVRQKSSKSNTIQFMFEIENDTIYLLHIQLMRSHLRDA